MGFRLNYVAKNRRKNKDRFYADHGTPERWQHSGKILEPTERAGVLAARALEESVLDTLALGGIITEAQREAALRFKLDFHRAGLSSHLSLSYNPVRQKFSALGPWDERTDAEEAAYQRWRNALRAIGIVYSDAVVTVVCFDMNPVPERIAFLREGLAKLAKWYGMENNAVVQSKQ